jgi:hypothetical protein
MQRQTTQANYTHIYRMLPKLNTQSVGDVSSIFIYTRS